MSQTAEPTPILQMHFTTEEVLTVRGEHAITLSDERFDDDPYRFVASGIIASRAALRSIRVLSESDLDDQDIPRGIIVGKRYANAPTG